MPPPALIVDVAERLSVPIAGLDRDFVLRIKNLCSHRNPDYGKKLAMGLPLYGVPRMIDTYRNEVDAGILSLPSGATQRLRKACAEAGIPLKFVDKRTEGSFVGKPLRYQGFPLRGYQEEMIAAAIAKERCVVRAATGVGKTTASLALAARIGLNTIVILPSLGLLKQWQKRAEKDLGLRANQIGILKGSTRKFKPLTLASQKTLWSRGVDEEMREFFGAVIIDEAHHAAARTFMEAIDSFPARYRVAFTADERRKDQKEFLTYDLVGDVAIEIDRARAEREGATVDVEFRVVETDFRFDAWDADRDFNALLNAMTADEKRNEIIIRLAYEASQRDQVIVLTHRREHARYIERELISMRVKTALLLGAQDKGDAEAFEQGRAGLLDGSVRVGVGTYGALGEGIDLPAVSVGIATTPIGTNKQLMNQVRGRVCRPSPETGKVKGVLYVVHDPDVFDDRVLRNIRAWNANVKMYRQGDWRNAG